MKILFIGNEDQKWGSTRLHVHNLAFWLKELGHDVHLNSSAVNEFEIIFIGKEIGFPQLQAIKKNNPNSLIGKINPSDIDSDGIEAMKICDFFVVGCIPERDYYLQFNTNVYIIPQIERIFTKKKVHEDRQEVVIGYHGNLHHLEQLSPSITVALERLSKEISLKFLAIYDENTLGEWKLGRPNIEIEVVQWNLETIENELLRCDIGITPGLYPISKNTHNFVIRILDILSKSKSGYKTDYITRYKNTTNSGREFVFHQLGIPVVSDFMPTAFHILGNPDNGFLAHNEASWYSALRKLAFSAELRHRVTSNAYDEFTRLYDPLTWTRRMIKDVHQLYQEQKVLDLKNAPIVEKTKAFQGLGPSDVVIDCGANTGQEIDLIVNTGAEIYAFEPNEHAFKVLEEKYRNKENVHLFQKGVFDRNDKVPLYMHESSDVDEVRWSVASSMLDFKGNVNKNKKEIIEVIDIAEFIQSLGKQVTILKLDVEGVEYEIINRLIDLDLLDHIGMVYVETHARKIPELAEKDRILRKRIKDNEIYNIDLNWI